MKVKSSFYLRLKLNHVRTHQCPILTITLCDNDNIIDFPSNRNSSILFKFKQQVTGQTGSDGTKDFGITVPFKYQSNFWRPLEMLLINYEISLMLTWSKNCFLVAGTAANQEPTFTITDKSYDCFSRHSIY